MPQDSETRRETEKRLTPVIVSGNREHPGAIHQEKKWENVV